jgi:hypothetical protein
VSKASFKPTNVQRLYQRLPGGTYYARTYQDGGTKWISLKTRVKAVAKLELSKLLLQANAVREAEASVRKGSVTLGELSAIYLHSGLEYETKSSQQGVPS